MCYPCVIGTYPISVTLADVVEAATRPDTRGQPLAKFDFWEGRRLGILYRGGWAFVFAADGDDIPGEYDVSSIDEGGMDPFIPPPNLVLSFAALAGTGERTISEEASATAGELVAWLLPKFTADRVTALPVEQKASAAVHPLAMRSFLEKWGPLDLASPYWARNFSQPAATLAEALELAAAGDVTPAFRIISEMHGEASSGSLLRVLALQALAYLFRGEVPRRCPGCGAFFTETKEYGSSFKRRDAKYCSTPCRNRVNKRRSRERSAQKGAKDGR